MDGKRGTVGGLPSAVSDAIRTFVVVFVDDCPCAGRIPACPALLAGRRRMSPAGMVSEAERQALP